VCADEVIGPTPVLDLGGVVGHIVAGVNAEPFGWLSANVYPGSSLARAHLQDDTRRFRKEKTGSSLDTAPPLHERRSVTL
jgi:hypothetical protein